MEIKEQPKLKFGGVDIVKVNFEAYKCAYNQKKEIKITCKPAVFYSKKKPMAFKIIMDIDLEAENFFHLIIKAIGMFEMNMDISQEIKDSFINANAPAIMFPYIRSFISTFTANTGRAVEGLIIPPQFFRGKIEEIIE